MQEGSASAVRIFQACVPPSTFCVDAHKAGKNAKGKETPQGDATSDGAGAEDDPLSAAEQPPLAPCGNDWLSIPGSLESDRKSSFQTVQKSGLLGASPSLPPGPTGRSASSLFWVSWALSSCIFHWLRLTDHRVRDISPSTQDTCFPYFTFVVLEFSALNRPGMLPTTELPPITSLHSNLVHRSMSAVGTC